MSDTPLLPQLSPAEARQVVQACDRFDEAWRAGRRPDPGEYLGAAAGPARAALLRQLLLLDWEYRRQAGDDPRAGDYRTRFPEDVTLIEDVAHEMSGAAGSTEIELGGPGGRADRPGDLGTGATAGADRYELDREVGQGGIGVVYRARDRHLGRALAVKVLREEYRDDPDARRRFVAEARVGSQLQHPAIVPVYEQGQFADGRPYFTMKLVEGHSLAALLRGRGDPGRDLPRLLGAFEQVCQAVAYAHSKGVVHRDLKPANVMVGAFGEVQVMDWGFAKVLAGDRAGAAGGAPGRPVGGPNGVSRSGVLMGTPAYMPPEQARGEAALVDRRADVFALGAMLCEILTGRPPYAGGSGDEVCRRAAAGDLGDAHARLDACAADAELRDLAKCCLAAEGADRPADAGAVAREVSAYLAAAQERLRRAEVERAAAEARAEEVGAKAHAERRARRLAVALAAALLLGAGAAVWQAAVATGAQHQALAAQHAALAAAEAEREAKETADAKEAETRAVLGFVQDRVLAAARPPGRQGGLGHDVTLRRALEAALPAVATDFADQPLTEARLRMTLGDTFRFLGDARAAADQYLRARAIYSERHGADHPDALESVSNLAISYNALGRRAEALKLREEALPLLRARFGPDDPRTLAGIDNLAASYNTHNRHAEAARLREEALPLLRARLGPDNPNVLTCMNNLAVSYSALGRHAEALRLREELVPLLKAHFGPDHQNTLMGMSNLASSYYALQRYADALRLYEETLKLQQTRLPPDHPDTARTMHNLAATLGKLGRHADALRLGEQSLALRRAKLGPDHPGTLQSMGDVATALVELGRGAEAVPILDECVRRAAGQVVPPHLIPDALDLRLRHFRAVQDAAGCRATAETWEKLKRTDAAGLYAAARYRAVTAAVLRAAGPSPAAAPEADAEADRAMAWLAQAVAAGFKDAATMATDTDLDALRGRADFRKLVAEMADRK